MKKVSSITEPEGSRNSCSSSHSNSCCTRKAHTKMEPENVGAWDDIKSVAWVQNRMSLSKDDNSRTYVLSLFSPPIGHESQKDRFDVWVENKLKTLVGRRGPFGRSRETRKEFDAARGVGSHASVLPPATESRSTAVAKVVSRIYLGQRRRGLGGFFSEEENSGLELCSERTQCHLRRLGR